MTTTARARSTDPVTSHAAASSVATTHLEDTVLDVLQGAGQGMTTQEIAAELTTNPWSISPRMKPLEDKGLVVRNGLKKGSSGRRSTVWEAV